MFEKIKKSWIMWSGATMFFVALFFWVAFLARYTGSFLIGLLLPLLIGVITYCIAKWIKSC